MRIDQDINNSGKSTLVAWSTVQRTIEKYREYILYQTQQDANASPITIYPDMDNLYVGNAENLTGLTDVQRQTVMFHWIGAGANLILGSDLTQLDALGLRLLQDPTANKIADFSARFPMRPLIGNDNMGKGSQFQWWVAGPDGAGQIALLAAN
jgi:alpha-galactosidase